MTIFQNLRDVIGGREDIDSSWLPIEMYPQDWITKIPPISWNGTLRNSVATRIRLHNFERAGIRFDASYFFQQTIITFLPRFRKRVPYILAMDSTPLYCANRGFWYTHPHFDPDSRMSRIKTSITKSVYEGAFCLLPLSHGVKDSLINDYGIQEEKIVVVPPGINLCNWMVPDRSVRSSNHSLRVLFVGADYVRKGGDLLASLASEERFSNIEFHFVSKNYSGPIAQNIVVHDTLSPNDPTLISLYHSADIFCLPTRADTHSIATLEAMACGLPVVTTTVGGIADIILDGETGYAVPAGESDLLRQRLLTLAESYDLRLRMGLSGRKRVEQDFNLDTIARQVVELLSRAAATQRR